MKIIVLLLAASTAAAEPRRLIAPTTAVAEPFTVVAGWPHSQQRRLFGVDVKKATAIVWDEREIVELDAKSGAERASLHGVRFAGSTAYIDFSPEQPDFERDLQRFADMVARTGPWTTRLGRPFPVHSDGKTVLYAHDGGKFSVAAPVKRELGEVSPLVSPDGERVMLRSYGTANPLCVEALRDGSAHVCPRGLPAHAWISTSIWSPDGRWLYARAGECLYRWQAGADFQAVHCGKFFAFAPSPDGKSAILIRNDATEWIALPSGKLLGRGPGAPLGVANDERVLADNRGRVAVLEDGSRRLTIVDVPRKKRGAISVAGYFEGLRATSWEPDGTFLLLRFDGESDQLGRVDAAAILREPQ